MDTLFPLLISFLIVFFHIIGEKLSEHIERFHLNLLSLAAGLMVGTLFLELLPRISDGEKYWGGLIYVVFLVGFVIVHLLEKFLYQHRSIDKEFVSLKSQFEFWGFIAYQLLVGIINVVFFEAYGKLAVFVLIPFFVRAFALSVSSKHIIEKVVGNRSHLLIPFGPVIGTIIGLFFIHSNLQVFFILAITTGVIFYITVRDVIPTGREGKPLYFLTGILITITTFLIIGGG